MCEAELSFSYSLFVHNPKSVLLAALTDNKLTSYSDALVHIFFPLYIVVQIKLIRMRAQPKRIMFLSLMADPHFDEIRREHVPL